MNTPLRHLIAAACLLVGTLAFGAEGKVAGSAEESTKIAQAWLKLVDDGNYAQSWKEAASRFRASVTEEKWVGAMEQVRQPLGAANTRELAEATFSTELPRVPKGEYWVVKFKTGFEAAKANELVTLTADADGQWRVIGYFIRPAS
jgi:hypothetical protein